LGSTGGVWRSGGWRPNNVPLLNGNSFFEVRPLLIRDNGDGTSTQSEGLRALIDLVQEELSGRPLIPLDAIQFTCRDRVDNLYRVSAALLYITYASVLKVEAAKRELLS
jgi:hypothetical protein